MKDKFDDGGYLKQESKKKLQSHLTFNDIQDANNIEENDGIEAKKNRKSRKTEANVNVFFLFFYSFLVEEGWLVKREERPFIQERNPLSTNLNCTHVTF